MATTESGVRLAELLVSLSLATDLGTGQPMEHALRVCLLAVRAGRDLALPPNELRDIYYLSLLRFVGCTATSHDTAALAGGDEIAFYAGMAAVLMGEKRDHLGYLVRHIGKDATPLQRARLVLAALSDVHGAERTIAEHCEAACMLASRMGFGAGILSPLAHAFERWDGHGFPGSAAGEAIPLAARICSVARDVEMLARLIGVELTQDLLRRRRARSYDPQITDFFIQHAAGMIERLNDESVLESALAEEPDPHLLVADTDLDSVLTTFADFTDLKSPYFHGHSRAVAALTEAAGRRAGLIESDVVALRRAALVHDLERTGVANGIWDKPSRLTTAEWERVRLHPYLTQRVIARCGVLAPLAGLAGDHHEQLDGSGYPRGSHSAAVSLSARILAGADAYQAMTQDRPYRPALSPGAAADQLWSEVAAGRRDRLVIEALLEGSLRPPRSRSTWPAGLSDREVEVLRWMCRGASKPAIARRLGLSTKTVGRHVENIYNKIGVSTRAGAALFAMEYHLLPIAPFGDARWGDRPMSEAPRLP